MSCSLTEQVTSTSTQIVTILINSKNLNKIVRSDRTILAMGLVTVSVSLPFLQQQSIA